MSKWDGLNRRKFPRVMYPCLIIIRNEDDKEDVVLTHTENIGVGGVCVNLTRKLNMFSNVFVEIDLLDLEKHIQYKGQVVWNVRGKAKEDGPFYYNIGIEFNTLGKDDKERLNRVVKRLLKNNKEAPYVL